MNPVTFSGDGLINTSVGRAWINGSEKFVTLVFWQYPTLPLATIVCKEDDFFAVVEKMRKTSGQFNLLGASEREGDQFRCLVIKRVADAVSFSAYDQTGKKNELLATSAYDFDHVDRGFKLLFPESSERAA